MDDDLTATFNRLSEADRAKLKAAAGVRAMTDFIREDGARHPWKTPFYAAYMACLVAPIPVVPQAAILLGVTLAWAKYSKSEMARDLRHHLAEAFTAADIMKKFGDHVEPDPDRPGAMRLRNMDLFMKSTYETLTTAGRVCADTPRGFCAWFRPGPPPASGDSAGTDSSPLPERVEEKGVATPAGEGPPAPPLP